MSCSITCQINFLSAADCVTAVMKNAYCTMESVDVLLHLLIAAGVHLKHICALFLWYISERFRLCACILVV